MGHFKTINSPQVPVIKEAASVTVSFSIVVYGVVILDVFINLSSTVDISALLPYGCDLSRIRKQRAELTAV